MNLATIFATKLMTGSQLFWLKIQGDEKRAQLLVNEAAQLYATLTDSKPVRTYSYDCHRQAAWATGIDSMTTAIESLNQQSDGIYVFYDVAYAANQEENRKLRRAIINLCKSNQLNGQTVDPSGNVTSFLRPIVLVTYEANPHLELRDFTDILELPLPDSEHFKSVTIPKALRAVTDKVPEEILDPMAHALLGLSEERAITIVAGAFSLNGGIFDQGMLELIADEKCAVINQVPGLHYKPYRTIAAQGDLGGYDNMMRLMRRYAATRTPLARKLRIEKARGVCLIGPAGTGKTTAAEIIAKCLGNDLVEMDPSKFLDKWMGASQKNADYAFSMISALKNVTVKIDEADKMFAHAHESQQSDAGVGSHIMSKLLTFTSSLDVSPDSDSMIFVVMTMNRVAGLPPELLRSGRFNALLFADLPDEDDRLDILSIHLRKRGVDPKHYGKALRDMARSMSMYSGAEIEALVSDARAEKFLVCYERSSIDGSEPTADDIIPDIGDLLKIRDQIRPAALRNPELKEITEFGRANCESVSSKRQLAALQDPSRSVRVGNN
jgi:hypothetical protein